MFNRSVHVVRDVGIYRGRGEQTERQRDFNIYVFSEMEKA